MFSVCIDFPIPVSSNKSESYPKGRGGLQKKILVKIKPPKMIKFLIVESFNRKISKQDKEMPCFSYQVVGICN